tara:strand:+ start:569 stop:817 length:249 start_codon:yes stop_codon:yes gene_type:complete
MFLGSLPLICNKISHILLAGPDGVIGWNQKKSCSKPGRGSRVKNDTENRLSLISHDRSAAVGMSSISEVDDGSSLNACQNCG